MAIISIPSDKKAAFDADYTRRLAGGLTADQALQASVQQLASDMGVDPVSIQQSLNSQGDSNAPVDVT